MVREKDLRGGRDTEWSARTRNGEKEMIDKDQKDDLRRMISQQIALVFACVSLCSGM